MTTTRFVILLLRLLAPLPLPLLRGIGAVLAWLLYRLIGSRRRIALTNLRLCFPQMPAAERQALARKCFTVFVQAWLDRAWLWHGRPEVTRKRLHMTGDLSQFAGTSPLLLFAPHFVGLDAGATALSQQIQRQFATIYTPQSNREIDAWVAQGRQRFGNAKLYNRSDGIKPIVAALRAGEPVYLLPDMDFGERDSLFVPFYGMPAATVPSLPRFARLGRARVVPVVTRMTPQGYEVKVMPAWEHYPSGDVEADTALMNERLQGYIDAMPEQYFWVHKRFKTRPPGEASVY
jgi:KDO2-lipid IV(A) lauroyltransferase